jgi:hypothetical protein
MFGREGVGVAEFRRDPHGEGRAALGDLGRAVLFGVIAAAAWTAASSYWPTEWTEPDESTRDRIVLYACGGLGLLAAFNLITGLVGAARWRRARRWERMLDDPIAAHLVPPLASHVRSVRSGRAARAGATLILGAAAIGLTGYGALAMTGRVPAVHDDSGDDSSSTLLVYGLVLTPLALASVTRRRRSRRASVVERLSKDSSIAPAHHGVADVAARRASSIPRLEVLFGGEQAGRTSVTTAGRPRRTTDAPLNILYLRLFDNDAGTRRFTRGRWRFEGYVHLLRSADQVDDDELEAAQDRGTMASLFITTPEQLDAALRRQATGRFDEPRPHGFLATWRWATNAERGRYPVRALLCHGNFWKSAVDLLLQRMDVVVIDLTGYRPQHTGTRYELQRVVDRFPIERVSLVAEAASDRPFLVAQLRAAWAQMAGGSPNAGTGARTVHVVIEPGT